MSEFTFKQEANLYNAYDVVVAGGGPAGIGAALAAAQNGVKVLLIEGNGCLGGTSTAGNLPFYLGAMTGSIPYKEMLEKNLPYSQLPRPRKAVGGVFDKMVEAIKAEGGGVGPCVMGQSDEYPGLDRLGCHDEFTFDIEIGKRVLDDMMCKAGVDLMYYTHAMDVEREGNKILGVYVHNKSGVSFVPCKMVVDCTGDADLVARAGYETYKGDRVTGEMTAMSLVAQVENVDAAAMEKYLNEGGDPWMRPACAAARAEHPEDDKLPKNIIIFPMVQPGVFMINSGTAVSDVDGTNGDDLTKVTLWGRRRAKFLTEELFRKHIPGAENCRLRSTAAYPGIRETRRIVAEYILTEEDLLEGKKFPDTIALAGRHFDLTRKGEHGQPFADKKISVRGGVARIPFRALVPKGADDIIVAGRCIAADGQALGPARIMSTCMATGEAAGTAAALKVKHGISIRDVDIYELHTILKANGAEFEG